MSARLVAVMGATASGKAELAAAAARATGAIVLSCDSMKVYRGMDAGTAKPAPPLREGVAWRGLDLVDPWEAFDASRFRDLFEATLADARAAGRPLILSGGTMLYLKAATEGLCAAPPRDADLREGLERRAEVEGTAALHRELALVDPAAAARIHENDLRRIVRALEVFRASGRPLTSFQGQFGAPRRDVERVVFAVRRARPDMDRRIDARVEHMFAAGWVAECERLLAHPRGVSREAAQALGYRQVFDWLRAGRPGPLEDVVAKVRTATRRFARRQLTWLKHVAGVRELDTPADGSALVHLGAVVAAVTGS